MERDQQVLAILCGFVIGVFSALALSIAFQEATYAETIKKYKDAEIVCAQISDELVCREVQK